MEDNRVKRKRGEKASGVWKVHTQRLLEEIIHNNPGMGILNVPINIFGKLLALVADRAIQLNDPILNGLMCRLTMYEQADPYSADYDKKGVEATMRKYEKVIKELQIEK